VSGDEVGCRGNGAREDAIACDLGVAMRGDDARAPVV